MNGISTLNSGEHLNSAVDLFDIYRNALSLSTRKAEREILGLPYQASAFQPTPAYESV